MTLDDAKKKAREDAIEGYYDAVGLLCGDDTSGSNEVHAAITAYERSLVASGWVLVPREPTRAMIDAAGNYFDHYQRDAADKHTRDCYAAMIAAASPQHQSEGE